MPSRDIQPHGAVSLSAPAVTSPESPQIVTLREAVSSLKTKLHTLTERFNAIEGRLDELGSRHANVETKLNELVEAQQAAIT